MTAMLVDRDGVVITHADVRDSIAVARSHGEKFFEQIVWQVENQVWTILGYASWDEMREAEYRDFGVVAPRADRPELTSRLRSTGMTQQQIADTLGVSVGAVNGDLKFIPENETPAKVTNSRGQQRPPSYAPSSPGFTQGWRPAPVVPNRPTPASTPVAPQEPRRKPLADGFRDASLDLAKLITRLENLAADDRLPRNRDEVARYANDLIRARDALSGVIDQMSQQKGTAA